MPYGAQPSTDTADELRLLVGDTNINNQLLEDAEVTYYLGKFDKIECAAYHAAVNLRAKFSGKARKSIGSATIDHGAIVAQLDPVIESLGRRCGATGLQPVGPPTAGGLTSPRPISDLDFDNPAAVNR